MEECLLITFRKPCQNVPRTFPVSWGVTKTHRENNILSSQKERWGRKTCLLFTGRRGHAPERQNHKALLAHPDSLLVSRALVALRRLEVNLVSGAVLN